MIDYPGIIHPFRDVRNAGYPTTAFYGRCQHGLNHLVGYRHKTVFQRTWRLGNKSFGYAGTTNLARFRFRSSYGAAAVRVVVMQAFSNASSGDPRVDIEFVNATDVVTTTIGPFQGQIDTSGSGSDPPDEWRIAHDTLSITPNKVYHCTLRTYDSARPMSVTVMEIGSGTIDGAVDFYGTDTLVANAPIYDATRENMLGGLGLMYRQNGGLQVNWAKIDGSAFTRSSATHANVVNGSSTGTPTTATPGYSCNLLYRNSQSRTSIPVELAVYAAIPAGSGTVRLIDTAGTVHLTATVNNATPQWFVATGSITASDLKFDFQAAGDGANTLSLYAVSLIEYEA